jgi:sigma-B regulation protein RsbU (phosphoserine phosphatase)
MLLKELMRSSRYSTMLRLVLALVALAGLADWAADAHDRFELGLHLSHYARDPFTIDDNRAQITNLEPEAERAGVIKGSTILSVYDIPYTGSAMWAALTNPISPGEILDATLRRPDGTITTAHIKLLPQQTQPGSPSGLGHVLQLFGLIGLMPLLCMLIGYWVVFAKPTEPNACLLLILLLFPEALFSLVGGLSSGGWLLFRGLYFFILQAIGPLALLPFALYFPERSRFEIRLPWFKWTILVPALLCATVDLIRRYGQYYRAGNPPWLIQAAARTDHIQNALSLACIILYFLLLFDKLRSASTEDARRRLRVLLTGTGIGLAALLIIFVLLPDLGFSPNSPGHLWVAFLGGCLFLIAPLTLAYVILVQRAMDVSVLIRQGTRYAMARATLWIVQLVLIGIVTYRLLLPLLTQKTVPREQLWQLAVFLLLIVFLRVIVNKQSRTWLDRMFFREAYDSEMILSELSYEVRRFTESEPLLQTVSRRISETLHVSRIATFVRDGKTFNLCPPLAVAPAGDFTMTLAAHSSTIRNLSNTRRPALVYDHDPEPWYLLASTSERDTLGQLGAELLLPLPGRDRLMGVIALGPKRSEAPYSKSDLNLLQTLANQTGMALEVSELAHSLAREAGLRERANREMEIAREVQERLFPQEIPQLEGVSIAGACRPAQGVGGDYYDVFPLSDGRLGIAIGDVSGKGISAALLMASLRASLRGVTIDNPRDFAKLMDKVNRLVYESSASNRYATFFFGALDPETHILECVNAGHNAPLVLRRQPDGEFIILRLEADGPVVGLLPFAPYSEQSIRLQPGDLLVAYTDGISEAMTHDDEEWGEDRMMAAAAKASDSRAEEILRSIFAEADTFTAGAPQHDDMTLLILKLNSPA